MGGLHKIKVLFVSHEASRTGAPLSLLTIVEHIEKTGLFEPRVLIRSEGPLEDAFRILAPTDVYYKKIRAKSIREKLRNAVFKSKRREEIVKAVFEDWKPHIVYSNTAANAEIIAIAKRYDVPVIVHLRELTKELKAMREGELTALREIPRHYLVNSTVVRDEFAREFSVPLSNISLATPFVDPAMVRKLAGATPQAALRQKLGIPHDAFIIGGAGLVSRRKGVDLFIDVARAMIRELGADNVRFVWVGGPLGGPYEREMIRKGQSGLPEHTVIFTDVQENPYPYYNIFDVLLVSSREEPFGRVILEAGILGKSFVSFKGAGGPNEFARRGWGYTIDDGDIRGMARWIKELRDNANLRNDMGSRVSEEIPHVYSAERVMPVIIACIKRYAKLA